MRLAFQLALAVALCSFVGYLLEDLYLVLAGVVFVLALVAFTRQDQLLGRDVVVALGAGALFPLLFVAATISYIAARRKFARELASLAATRPGETRLLRVEDPK
jgi:hypothetical protein